MQPQLGLDVLSLLKRIARAEGETYESSFEVPEAAELVIIFGDSELELAPLVAIRDASKNRSGPSLRDLAELFDAASHGYGEAAMGLLKEWFRNGDENELRAAVSLLQAAPSVLPFEHLDEIGIVLDRANNFGEDCKDDVETELLNLVAMGVRHGIPHLSTAIFCLHKLRRRTIHAG